VREVGALLGLDGLAADADGQCGITVDATITVHLLHDPQAEVVALFAVVGTLPADRRAVVLELLLAANLFWAHVTSMMGMTLHVASPDGYQLPDSVIDAAARIARDGAEVKRFIDPRRAVAGVDAVYTDVWTSMGEEAEADERRRTFARYQVNGDLMAAANSNALFMHCLPAHRGEEVTSEVIDSPASVVFDQAENRLHTQKALLQRLVGR
jgi:ornithine carbamoyltransferase